MMNRRFQLAWCSAAALALTWIAMPQLGIIATAPMLAALRGATWRRALIIGLITSVGPILVVAGILHAGVGLFFAAGAQYALTGMAVALCISVLGQKNNGTLFGCITTAAIWTTFDWLQTLIPHSAPHILGNSQHHGHLLMLARIGGSYLITFVMILCSAACIDPLLTLWQRKSWGDIGRSATALVWAIFFTVVCYMWACFFSTSTTHFAGRLDVAALQGGIPTWVYSRARTQPNLPYSPLKVYTELTRRTPSAGLTIWPETAVWQTYNGSGNNNAYAALLKQLRAQQRGGLLVGTPRRDANGHQKNSAVFFRDDNSITFADKQRLVPFVEDRFAQGTRMATLDWPSFHTQLGVLFCFENAVPSYGRALAASGSELLIVLADGSRLGHTPFARVHTNHSILRAVETGRTVVHAGQHGFTQIIDPHGDTTQSLQPFTSGVLQRMVTLYSGATPYVFLGPWIVWVSICWIVFWVIALMGRQMGLRQNPQSLPRKS